MNTETLKEMLNTEDLPSWFPSVVFTREFVSWWVDSFGPPVDFFPEDRPDYFVRMVMAYNGWEAAQEMFRPQTTSTTDPKDAELARPTVWPTFNKRESYRKLRLNS